MPSRTTPNPFRVRTLVRLQELMLIVCVHDAPSEQHQGCDLGVSPAHRGGQGREPRDRLLTRYGRYCGSVNDLVLYTKYVHQQRMEEYMTWCGIQSVYVRFEADKVENHEIDFSPGTSFVRYCCLLDDLVQYSKYSHQ
jgi:hypothetical protein